MGKIPRLAEDEEAESKYLRIADVIRKRRWRKFDTVEGFRNEALLRGDPISSRISPSANSELCTFEFLLLLLANLPFKDVMREIQLIRCRAAEGDSRRRYAKTKIMTRSNSMPRELYDGVVVKVLRKLVDQPGN